MRDNFHDGEEIPHVLIKAVTSEPDLAMKTLSKQRFMMAVSGGYWALFAPNWFAVFCGDRNCQKIFQTYSPP